MLIFFIVVYIIIAFVISMAISEYVSEKVEIHIQHRVIIFLLTFAICCLDFIQLQQVLNGKDGLLFFAAATFTFAMVLTLAAVMLRRGLEKKEKE